LSRKNEEVEIFDQKCKYRFLPSEFADHFDEPKKPVFVCQEESSDDGQLDSFGDERRVSIVRMQRIPGKVREGSINARGRLQTCLMP
jgi:hypothetical protein